MFLFGIRCIRCNYELIAPDKTEFLDDKIICHLWHCPRCKALFESFPRFPPTAKSVRETMMTVDVLPPLNEAKDA
jgi:phage FluMu protein Com